LKLNRFEERLDGFERSKDVISGQEFEMKDSIALEPMKAYVLDLEK